MSKISIKEFALANAVSETTVRRAIASGTLPAWRMGRLIKVESTDAYRLFKPINPAGKSGR